MKKKKVAFHNLGCKVNAYETEAMQQILEEAGYETVPFEETADVYVINTCSVTNIADRKSRQMLHRAKKQNPQAVVVAVGCYAQAMGEELLKDSAVDIVVGNNRKKDLVQILQEAESAGRETCRVPDIAHTPEYENLSLGRTAEHTRAYIKVQDGCNQFCSYCRIPYVRGRVRSRELQDVVREVENLARNGYQEIVLTGIHLSSYGTERDDGIGLLQLVQAVHEVEGVRRIRLGSLEPRIITEDFVRAISALPKICPHFHLSLQSGCDETLRRMNRRYDTGEYYEKCTLLREYFTHPALTTDVIVGFPGETEEEFAQTVKFLEKVRFYETHIFKYSRRDGTKAARMNDQVPEETKAARSAVLQELNNQNKAAFEAYYLGRPVEVLFEEEKERQGIRYCTGYTREYVKVTVPSDGRELVNKISDCIFRYSDVQ